VVLLVVGFKDFVCWPEFVVHLLRRVYRILLCIIMLRAYDMTCIQEHLTDWSRDNKLACRDLILIMQVQNDYITAAQAGLKRQQNRNILISLRDPTVG